jgi:2-C-methyl-D-erythritol 4-phosphate cytidylyltransferase
MNSIGVVIPAGGAGRRFGSEQPKQLLMLHKRPVLDYCVKTFHEQSQIAEIIVVIPAGMEQQYEFLKVYAKVKICYGGVERWQSVQNGIGALRADITHVMVHDAARPLVSQEIIRACIQSLMQDQVSIVAMQATDTIKQVEDLTVQSTIERNTIFLAQTPQNFPRHLLEELYGKIHEMQVTPTDEASIFEFFKVPVHIILGNKANNKLTFAEDVSWFEFLLQKEGKL